MMASITIEPVIPPPPGSTSDFVDPPSRANLLVIGCLVCIVLVSFFVWGRAYARIRFGGTRSLAWDDVVCLFAAAGCIGYSVFCILGTRIGNIGVHMWDIPKQNYAEFTLITLILAPILYGPFIFLTKLTIFLLYHRIFKPINWMRCAVYIGIAVTFLFYAIYTTMVVIWCTPDMGTSWTNFFANPSVQVRCRKSNDLSVFQNAFNIFSDFYILLLPLPLLRHLNLRAFAKLGVTLIFFVGLLACVASTSGIYYRMHTRDNNDFTWQIVPSQVAMVFEMNIGVVCSCMPSVAVLIRHWAKKYEWWESVCRSQSKTIALRDLDTLQYVVRRDDNTGQWHVVNTDRLRAQLQDQLTAPNASKTSWADPREVSVREESGNIIARPEPAVTAATSCAEEEPVQIQSSSVPERLEVSSSTGDGTVTTSDLSMVGETNRRLEESMSWRPYRYSEPRFSMEPRYSTHMV